MDNSFPTGKISQPLGLELVQGRYNFFTNAAASGLVTLGHRCQLGPAVDLQLKVYPLWLS